MRETMLQGGECLYAIAAIGKDRPCDVAGIDGGAVYSVRHGRVAGIARLGEKAKVGELQPGHQIPVGRHQAGIVPAPLPGVEQEQSADHDADRYDEYESGGIAQPGISRTVCPASGGPSALPA